MSFDGNLGWAYRRKGVDHTESVPAARSDGEDFQRCVGHETGVGVTELSLAVDEHRFRILTGVDGETTWVSFGGILVEPIAYQHDMRGQIEVVQVRVGVTGRRLTDDDASVQTIQFLETGVSVPEVSTCITSPLVSEGISLLDGALRHKWDTIVVLCSTLPDSVPVNGQLHTFHVVFDIDHNSVVFTNLNTWSGNHTIDGQDTSLDTIGQNALTVAPYGVRGIRGTYLTGRSQNGVVLGSEVIVANSWWFSFAASSGTLIGRGKAWITPQFGGGTTAEVQMAER